MRKHTLHIILYRAELVRYIKEMGYVISMSTTNEEGLGANYKMADILDKEDAGTDGNNYIATRSINYAVATLRGLVRKHAVDPQGEMASHNAFGIPQEYRISLTIETDTPKTTSHTLQEMFNRYVAFAALADWGQITASESVAISIVERDKVKTDVLAYLNPPTKHVRGGWLW